MRMLGGIVRKDEGSQRENIFHSRSIIWRKVYSLIIYGGSCNNVVSVRLVTKMNLDTKPHPRPYKLQWLNEEEGELKMDKQVDVVLFIRKYEDNILCDTILWRLSLCCLEDHGSLIKKNNNMMVTPTSTHFFIKTQNSLWYLCHQKRFVNINIKWEKIREQKRKKK